MILSIHTLADSRQKSAMKQPTYSAPSGEADMYRSACEMLSAAGVGMPASVRCHILKHPCPPHSDHPDPPRLQMEVMRGGVAVVDVPRVDHLDVAPRLAA